MKPHERRHLVHRGLVDLAEFVAGLNQLSIELAKAQPGFPSTRIEAERAIGHTNVVDDAGLPMPGIADPTGELVTNVNDDGRHRDIALADDRRLDELIERFHADTSELAGIVRRWNRAANGDAPTPTGDACEIAARAKNTRGGPAWEPVHVISNVGGLLDRNYRLGRWAYDFIRSTGRLPTRPEIQDHVDGKRVRRKAS